MYTAIIGHTVFKALEKILHILLLSNGNDKFNHLVSFRLRLISLFTQSIYESISKSLESKS